MSGLDFPHTCPKIDRAISSAKDILRTYFDEVISDVCPYISAETRKQLAEGNAESVYSQIEELFEGVRELNADMRRQAERQISDLEDELRDARSMIE